MTDKKEREKKIAKKAIDILQGMYMAHKNIKIYDLNNHLVIKQIGSVCKHIQELLQAEEEVIFTLRLSTLYLNGIKVLFSFSNYFLFKYLNVQLSKKEIGLLKFQKNLTRDELKQFLFLLGKKEKKLKKPFETFLNTLQENKIKHEVYYKFNWRINDGIDGFFCL